MTHSYVWKGLAASEFITQSDYYVSDNDRFAWAESRFDRLYN